jgi:hypothetical protein
MADTFVAGQAETALDVAGGANEAFGGGSLQTMLRGLGSGSIVNAAGWQAGAGREESLRA